MIRVCHIISGDLWAGAEVVVYNLLKNIKKYEHMEVSAIFLNEGRLANEIRHLDIPVDVVNETNRSFFQLIKDTRNIIIRKSPNIIHSHRYKENIIAFLSSKYKKDIRLVSTQHGMPEYIRTNHNKKYYLLQKLNLSLLSRSYRKVIAVSKDIQDIFINKYGFQENKIAMIHNGTELHKNNLLKRDKDIFVIGSMGRIFPVKDYSLMVEIAREISKETDKIRFELAGDGPDRAMIMRLIERYRLEKTFILRGFVENSDDFYQCLDIYLNTSLHEGIPMSILEAMSYEIPIIAPNIGGLKEMMNDGIEGYLVDGRDPKVFSNRCLHLYNNRSLGKSMGSSAREKVENDFSNDRMAREYYHLYLDITCGKTH